MKKTQWILLILVLAMVGSTAFFLLRTKGRQKLGAPGVKLVHVPLFDERTNQVADVTVELPRYVLNYFSSGIPVSDVELNVLPKDTTFGKRRYWGADNANVDVSVVLMGQDRTSIHKPQFCLVGQGWSIDKTEQLTLPMQDPHPYELPLMKLSTSIHVKDSKGNPLLLHGIYVYWFVADGKMTATDRRMWSSVKHFLRTGTLERWAYISYFSRCLPGQEEQTFERMKEFITASVPSFQLVPGTPTAHSQTNLQTAFK